MLISELNFPHLLAERDARLARELEQRRVIAERLTEQTAQQDSRRQAPTASPVGVPTAGRWHRRTAPHAQEAAC